MESLPEPNGSQGDQETPRVSSKLIETEVKLRTSARYLRFETQSYVREASGLS